MWRATRAAASCSLPTAFPEKPRMNVSIVRPATRVEIDRARQSWKGQQRLDLRTEHERAGVQCVIQRLHTEMIAGQEKLTPSAVPHGERKHAGQPIDEAFAPLPPAMHQHFAVAAGHEDMAGGHEFAPQGAKIIDLT